MTPPPNEPTPQPPESGEDGVGEPPLRATTGGHRKKSAWVRSWLLVELTGETQVVEAGKHAIMRRTGLPARDLRILDPVLSYPSTILGRERAVVVSLEHIKAIITAHEVLFFNARDPLITPFVAKLQGIFRHREAVKSTQELYLYIEFGGNKVLCAGDMEELPGALGTSASLTLRLGQTIFAVASLLFMCFDVQWL